MSNYVHGDNLFQKENHKNEYRDEYSQKLLAEIRTKYNQWLLSNQNITGPGINSDPEDYLKIEQRTKLLNEYKDFLDAEIYAKKFDSRSNLHSSVLEEFIYILFKDMVAEISENALIGKSHAFKDMFFRGNSFRDMLEKPCVHIETKDHDFVIGVYVDTDMKSRGSKTGISNTLQIPVIAIECKTYLDKTMLEGSSTAADQLKLKNPNAIYIVVAERLKLTENVNLKKYSVDQIYVLRKERNVDRKYRLQPGWKGNPIYSDVVFHLFDYVRNYLTEDWNKNIAEGIKKGMLM